MNKLILLITCLFCFSTSIVYADIIEYRLSPDYTIDYEALSEKTEYIVGYSSNHKPFSYTNDYGYPAGMAIGIMEKIASVANIDFKYVEIETYAEHIDINLSLFTYDKLDYHTNDSNFYVKFPILAITNSNFVAKEKQSIGILNYRYFIDAHSFNPTENSQILYFDNYEKMKYALENGEIDYMIATNLYASEIVSTSNTSYSFMAVNKDLQINFSYSNELSQDFINALNDVISNLVIEEINTIIMSEAMKSTSDLSLDILSKYSSTITIFLLTIALFFSTFVTITMQHTKNRLNKVIEYDMLTGLSSEMKFARDAKALIQNPNLSFAIVSIDIDNFKYINEIYGYEAGTKSLIAVAQHLKSTFRHSSLICRVFADNFLVLVPGYTLNSETLICGKPTCIHCTKNILNDILGEAYNLETSVGIYIVEDRSLSISHMIDCANTAKSSIKRIYGKSQSIYSHEMDEQLRHRNEIVFSMEQGVENHEFKMLFQPKVCLTTHKIVGAEALVRWIKSDGVQIFPDSFISLFEKNGFIVRLDQYVFDAVCSFVREHKPEPKISVNLSGISLLENTIVTDILAIIKKYDVSPTALEIEITESAIVDNFDEALNKIHQLKMAGFSISMDDFGTGVSSLNRLKDIDIDILKIDKQFLSDTLDGNKGMKIIDSVIKMAKSLDIKVVAEGVETLEQADTLRDLGCDIAQGYYFARPLTQQDFIERLRNEHIGI